MKVGEMEVFPGQKLISGTTIKLFFGSGRGSNKIELPNMIGTTLEDSYLLLKENNLNIGEIIFNGVISDTLKHLFTSKTHAESKLQFGDMVDLENKVNFRYNNFNGFNIYKMKRASFFNIIVSECFFTKIESNLLVNSVIDKNERYYSNKSFSNLIVPFIDDFSYKLNIPDTLLWENKSVFINRSYGYNPITIELHLMD